jgi:hypothetical protein
VSSHPQILTLILVISFLPAVSLCIVADQELSLEKSKEAGLPPTNSVLLIYIDKLCFHSLEIVR